jgi:hypothetical protein
MPIRLRSIMGVANQATSAVADNAVTLRIAGIR